MGYVTSLWSVGIKCPCCVAYQCLSHPQPSCWGGRESLEAVQALPSNSRNTSALSAVLQPQMQSTAPYRLLRSNLAPSQQHPLQIFIYDSVFILKYLFNMANTEIRLYHLIVSHCPWNPFLKLGIMFVAFQFLGITVVLRKRLCIAVIS